MESVQVSTIPPFDAQLAMVEPGSNGAVKVEVAFRTGPVRIYIPAAVANGYKPVAGDVVKVTVTPVVGRFGMELRAVAIEKGAAKG